MASRFPFIVIGPRALSVRPAAVLLASTMIAIFAVATGCIREDDLTLEQRAHQLYSQLMCPVCDAQTIDGSNAPIAQSMRLKVRELLDDGKTNSEIKEYFVLRSPEGEAILAAPEGGGFNLLAWIVPFFITFGGIGIALLTIRNLRRSNARSAEFAAAGSGSATDQNDLAKYLAQVDRDLGISPIPAAGKAGPGTPSPDEKADS
ncbi:MAG: cytochrome c-type biogenesis protein CcmH [Dehalococcoidia bacterium]|jgi:cytochrome c-type biogenesis protein CcmH|nr:cytochrome c-type biogenesis protein CcmH [Dehalococcoidia bacterium]HIN14490.1 cytochrome c-type biogenesis protein CcmH [Dehalococcoidia bacterium]|tara:strand:- start:4568 stop:5179 length:612 start_codon:yes stop_codon:yes gene_type:complete